MNTNEVHKVLDYIDKEYIPLVVDDLKIIVALLNRNPHLINDYPSLETVKDRIDQIIKEELEKINETNKNLDEIHENKE